MSDKDWSVKSPIDDPKPWFGRIVYEREGVEREFEFKTEAEADAFVKGFSEAKSLSCEGDDDMLEEYFAHASDEPLEDEE